LTEVIETYEPHSQIPAEGITLVDQPRTELPVYRPPTDVIKEEDLETRRLTS